jgi:hypothetical protein
MRTGSSFEAATWERQISRLAVRAVRLARAEQPLAATAGVFATASNRGQPGHRGSTGQRQRLPPTHLAHHGILG